MTEDEYDRRSADAVSDAWAEYEAEGWDVAGRTFYPLAAYFVDDDLVVAITDTFRRDFRTCYHEHFRYNHADSPALGMTAGERRLCYREHLKVREQGKLIRNVKRIRGV
jgi:hypothetical protein